MALQASDFEFRNRFWLIGAIFGAGFFCYALDHVNALEALSRLILGGNAAPDSPALDQTERIVLAAGALLAILAALMRTWAEAYLHSSVVHDAAIHSERLVADGPYRRTRNPLYFANILLALGMGLLASRIGYVAIVAGMTVFVYRLILREEAGLLESQGDSFRRYCDAVPRLFPSVLPRIPNAGGKPNWADGFTGESFIWGFALGMAAFAITAREILLWAMVAGGFTARFLQDYLRKRGR